MAATGLGAARVAAGDLEKTTLRNGLDLILIRKAGVPLVTVEIAIRAGAFIESPELNGLTHLHEHMFFKANRAIPDQEAYLRRLEELGTSWNGSTSDEVVRYYFTLPSALLKEGLEHLRDAIQSPLFLAEELERERKVVIGEYDRAEANPSFHLNRAVNRMLFSRHFSRKNVIGDRQVISTCTRDKLEFIQDEFYVPNNAALIIAGEFDEAEARKLGADLFGGWARRPDPFSKNPVPPHPPLDRDEFQVVEKEVRTASILIGWHGPSAREDAEDVVAADVLSEALNHPASRFHRGLVDSGLATLATFSYYTQEHVGLLSLRLETTPGKALAALAAARREIDRLSEPGALSAEELSRAAQEIATQETFRREKARDFAISIGFWWSVGGIESYISYPERARKVAPADVERFARRWLPAGGARTAAAILVSPADRQSAGIGPEAMAAAFRGPASAPSAEVAALDLEGGARLIVRRVPGARVASLGVYFRGHAARSPEDKAGLEQLLLRTLADGLERSRADELTRLGARVHHDVQPDHSMMGILCLRSGLDGAADLLTEGLRTMEIQAADVDRNRARMISLYAKTMDNPDLAVGFLANRTFYPPGHPYHGYPGGTEESLKRLTLADVAGRRALLLSPAGILVVLVGDLDQDEGRRIAGRLLAGLPVLDRPGGVVPPLAGFPAQLTVEERAIPTCYILGKFRTPAPGEPDYEPLSLALAILHRKMFLEVRTRRALTYAVAGAIGQRGRNFGTLSVSTRSPEEALAAMYLTLDGLIEKPLSEDEVRGAALSFLTRRYLRLEAVEDQGDMLAVEELVAGDYRRALDLESRMKKVTPADIQRVLKEHVKGIHFGIIGPRELLSKVDRKLFTGR